MSTEMQRAYSLSFRRSNAPCRDLVTKFGGQPVWVQEPQWPISRSLGEQMTFICQIALYPEIFGQTVGRMAYIFMTDLEEKVVPAWDPDSGENAVIIQPGRQPNIQTMAAPIGPTLYEYFEVPGQDQMQARPCEYLVDTARRTDPQFEDEAHRQGMDDQSFEKYSKAVEGNKVGGSPAFLQEDAMPPGGKLLLQLDSAQVPFYVNFGDCGLGFAFISPDGSQGRFLFQSY